MDFELTEAQLLIQQNARQIARDVVKPRAAEVDETASYPHDYFEVFRDTGLLGLTLPADVGGADAGTMALALAVIEMARYDASAGLMLLLSSLATHTVKFFGDREQMDWYVGPVARGEKKAAFCLTEPSGGSDVAGMQSRARRVDDEYVITGEKCYISGGPLADQVIVFAKLGEDARSISGFLVDTKMPGFSVTHVDKKMGVRGVPTGTLTFDGVRVPKSHIVGGEGIGLRGPLSTLASLRAVVGARGVGLAEGAAAYALAFARDRQAFGASILDLQTIQNKFANMAIEIEAARWLVYKGATLVDEDKFGAAEAHDMAIAKAFASEMSNRVASEALQVLGGQGYMAEHPLERHYRDARQLMIVEGTSEIQRVVIARAMIDRQLAYPY